MIKTFAVCLLFCVGLICGFKLGQGSSTVHATEESLIESAIESKLTVNFRFNDKRFDCKDFQTCYTDTTLCASSKPNCLIEYVTYETDNVSVTCINDIK